MIGFVWHIWIGVALLAVSLLVLAGLAGSYLFAVQRQKYPNGKKQRRHQDL